MSFAKFVSQYRPKDLISLGVGERTVHHWKNGERVPDEFSKKAARFYIEAHATTKAEQEAAQDA